MTGEIWKDIPGYEGKYFVSSLGRLRNQDGRIMKPMLCTNGYLSACLWLHNKQRKMLIHRLVAEAFLANEHGYSDVNHIDEDKTNNEVTNLEWCTHRYNMNYGMVKEKIGASHRGKHLTPEHRIKCASATGRKWMSDATTEVLVKKDDVPSFLLLGYQIGRLKRHDRKSKSQPCRQTG